MPDPMVAKAHRFLRNNSTADLRFDEHTEAIKYVIEPGGRLVSSVMVAMLTAAETVLYIPDFGNESMEILTTLEEFDEQGEHGAAADRWRIYHGDPPDVRWAFFDIDVVRVEGHVLDSEAVMPPNPLAEGESALCRWVNREQQEQLRDLCRRRGIEVETPLLVGVDRDGLDIRRRFDIARIEPEKPMATVEEARSEIERMLGEGGG